MDPAFLEDAITRAVDRMSVGNSYHFRVPPTTLVGDGCSVNIGEHLERLGACRVLIVTDKMIVKLELMEPMLRSLQRHAMEYRIFDEVLPDPTDDVVRKGIEVLKASGCDTVLAFGGGSVIDAGKAISVFAANPMIDSQPITDTARLNPRVALVAVPTTAGTGSEVTDITVITNSQTHVKMPHQHASFIPDIAVIDPTLTIGIPPSITAATGMDVLTHAVESYLAKGVCSLGQALSYSAIQLVARYLRRAVGNGSDLSARHHMAEASYMAGMSFSNAGLGVCHAIAHQLGALYKIPHGTANALMLPEVMQFNLLVCPERIKDVARAFNLRIEHLDDRDAAQRGIDAVRELRADVGLPTRLEQVGARIDHFAVIARQALLDPTIHTNPRSVGYQDIIDMLQHVF